MRKVVSVVAIGLLLTLSLGGTPVTAQHSFTRHYTASSTVAWGDPHIDNTFIGSGVCSNGRDAPYDTAGCVFYWVGTLYDHRGDGFTVTVDDAVYGDATWLLVVVHQDNTITPDCRRDVCIFGQGTVQGEVPADATGQMVRIIPLTYYLDDTLQDPLGSASTGSVTIQFHGPL